jgi:hypothetical protein
MKWICVAITLAACSRSPRPIGSVNAVIGDTSFIRAFGRFPTPADDETLRVRTHVGYVAALLRTRDAPVPELRAQRERLLDELDRYVAAGRFPDSETDVGMLPTFLDAHTGVRCAVADLVETSAGTALMTALDRDHHNDYVADIAHDPRFAVWAERSGFTTDELAMIQPTYEHAGTTHHAVELGVAARYAIAPDAGTPFQLGLVGGTLRKVSRGGDDHGTLFAELDAAIGAAGPAVEAGRTPLAYDVHARLGTRIHCYPMTGGWHDTGITAGIGIDRAGARIARAITIPIDAWYRIPVVARTRAGIHGGPRFAVGDRGFGWNVGVDAVMRNLFVASSNDGSEWAPRDLAVSFDVSRIADLMFVGVSIGIGARMSHGYFAGE